VPEDERREGAGGTSAPPPARHGRSTPYRVPFLLLGVAVAAGVAAKLILPNGGSVAVQGALQRITVEGPVTPTALDIREQAAGGGGVILSVSLRRPGPSSMVERERLIVALPSDSSGPAPCPPQANSCVTLNGARTAYFRFPSQPWVPKEHSLESFYFAVSDTVTLPGVSPNLQQDAEHIAASLPPVSVLATPPGQPTQQVYSDPLPVDFGEQATTGESYSWSEGVSAPVDVGGWETWDYLSASSALSALNPVLDSGTDLTVQNRDNTRTFLAGALLGIAGGALVAAIPEVARARHESDR
jgi:hypothetical protein